ncbi:MAG: hypothetical protein CVT74_14650 [Alphaproteobacteria bacterium HGW-Alphaproteobacteria-13]|jgi:hypothetical protein|nr:MAG: hypothetical protein CVT74_14650 [Alphaproteobacteria bacterium HGW-Alphaproteobacteria-13]
MTVSAAPLSHRARAVEIQPRKLLQDFAYSLVSVTCWLAINCLAAAGLIVGLFVLMANASVDQFFVEAANLSNHYVAADNLRRSEFAEVLLYLFGGCVLFFCITRRGALMADKTPNQGEISND